MIKGINRILKLVGLNLVRAKRKAPKSEAKRVKEFVEEFDGPKKAPLSDYMGQSEWQNTPPVAVSTPCTGISDSGHTHFVGDDCPGGHRDPCCILKGEDNVRIGDDGHGVGYDENKNAERNTVVGYEAKVFVANPNAAFVPVDIGADDHEITRTEHEPK